jgi:hypothetical protein
MDNKIHSQFGMEITSEIKVTGKEIPQKLFATDLYIYTETMGKQIIYLPEKQSQYLADTTQNKLMEIDLSAQIAQFRKLKQMLGELFIQEMLTEHGKHIHLTNSDSSNIGLTVEADIIKFPGIEKTAYHSFNMFQSDFQVVKMPVTADEIISSMRTCMIVNGQLQESIMHITDIKGMDNPAQYDQYLNYSVCK